MTADIFADCVFFLKLNNLSGKEKKHLKAIISSNGGSFSFVLNEKCTHVIANNASSLGSSHLKKIQKHQISLVNPEFIWKCMIEKQLLEKASDFEKPVDVILEKVKSSGNADAQKNLWAALDELDRAYTFEDMDEEEVISSQDAEVAKYCFLQKDFEVAIVELLCDKESSSFPYKISTCFGPLNGSEKVQSCHMADNSQKACKKYAWHINDLKNKGFLKKDVAPPQAMSFASEALQKILLEEAINTSKISKEVGYFVESIWMDAVGHLSNLLSCPVNNISLNDVGKAEGILLQLKISLAAGANPMKIVDLMSEFYQLIPHKTMPFKQINKELLTKKQELCQLIRDMLNVCETTPSSRTPSSLAKYRALRCKIGLVDRNTDEFAQVSKQILEKNYSNESIEILNIYQIGRLSEATDFDSKLENVRPLLHASSSCNFVGILSRGLLLPKMIIEELGYGRTDAGNLGSGIYFTDSISTSVKYSELSNANGTRLLVVCDVALDNSKKVYKKDYTITAPPDGFHSVHGVRKAEGIESDFEDDEFVVYNRNQIRMTYAVQFRTNRDLAVNLQPNVLSVELEETPEDSVEGLEPLESSAIYDMSTNTIKGGLQNTQGEQIPLEKLHVKAKVMDLVAQVVIFQIYKNSSMSPIEAKYVFPLDSTAAVCGFEAFINGKHIIGEVKEKKQARQEYRTAVREGHGAYLMDQDAPDLFTVSVGNLPPEATVIIKITYIMELQMSYGDCTFTIPGAVASWQKDTLIKENTQDTVTKVGIEEDGVPEGCFSLEMSIELPYKIRRIYCSTHDILSKKTDCKAVIQTKEGSSFRENGFILSIDMENPYVPRMWVEKHPEKDSEACMLVFQPEFSDVSEEGDVTICLDCSNSMKPCFQNAQLLALHLACSVFCVTDKNIVLFGTSYKEFDFYPRNQYDKADEVENFIKTAKPNMGGTEFWKPLHSLGLVARPKGVHDIILITDGHIQNERQIFQILKRYAGKIRLFVCGVGAMVNRHLLKRLALLGNGTYEFFDHKTKSKWKDQLESLNVKLLNKACTSVSVKWTRFTDPDMELCQAPAKLPSVFSEERLLVYGFIRNCTQATLKGLIADKELETMVSTTELQKTTGTMLHKLTARALIRDYEDGILHEEEDENEMEKQLRKSAIIDLSKEYSIVTQFTSFIAVEKRDADEQQQDAEPNILDIVSSENVDFLPYMAWEDESANMNQLHQTLEDNEFLDSTEALSSSSEDFQTYDGIDDDFMSHSLQCADDGYKPLNLTKKRGLVTSLIRPLAAAVDMSFEDISDTSDNLGTSYVTDEMEHTQTWGVHEPLLSTDASSTCYERKGKSKRGASLLRPKSVPFMGSVRTGSALQREAFNEEGDALISHAERSIFEQADTPSLQLQQSGESFHSLASGSINLHLPEIHRVTFGSSAGTFLTESDLSQPLAFCQSLSIPCSKAPPPPPPTAPAPAPRGRSILQSKRLKGFSSTFSQPPPPPLPAGLPVQSQRLTAFSSISPQPPPALPGSILQTKRPMAFSSAFSQPPPPPPPALPGSGVQSERPMAFFSTFSPPPPALSRSFVQSEGPMVTDTLGAASPLVQISPENQPSRAYSCDKRFFSSLRSRLLKESEVPLSESVATAPVGFDRSHAFPRVKRCEAPRLQEKSPEPLCDLVALTPPQPFYSQLQSAATVSKPQVQLMGSVMGGTAFSSPHYQPAAPAGGFGSAAYGPPNYQPVAPVAGFGSAAYSSPNYQPLSPTASVGIFAKVSSSITDSHQPRTHFAATTMAYLQPPLRASSQKLPVGEQSSKEIKEGETPQFASRRKQRIAAKKKVKTSKPPSWSLLSVLQTEDGSWLLTPELGKILNINVPFLSDDFLIKKGIFSLGTRGVNEVRGLIATLLVLQAIQLHKLIPWINFKSLMKLDESSCASEYYLNIEKAIKWARKVDQQYPAICVRLGMGKDWDSVTKQLLRIAPLAASSDLCPALEML